MSSPFPSNHSGQRTESVGSDRQLGWTGMEFDETTTASRNSIHGFRFVQFMQAVQQIATKERRTIRAQIDAREKRRAAGFKRRDVWIRDAAFMKELQTIMAKEKLKGFENLLKLAEECQKVRDDLGPLEADGIDAEQQLEGEFWKLQQAQQSIFDNFYLEFQAADTYSSAAASENSSPYTSNRGAEDVPVTAQPERSSYGIEKANTPLAPEPNTAEIKVSAEVGEGGSQNLLDIRDQERLRRGHPPLDPDLDPDFGLLDWHSDSGVGDIDRPIEHQAGNSIYDTRQWHQSLHLASLERHPELSTDFHTRRERINKWILNGALLSRLEASTLKGQFNSEDGSTPSNWSQLVISYWDIDAAARPHLHYATSSTDNVVHDFEPRVSKQSSPRERSLGNSPSIKHDSHNYPKRISDLSDSRHTDDDATPYKDSRATSTEHQDSINSQGYECERPLLWTESSETLLALPPSRTHSESRKDGLDEIWKERKPP